MLEFISQMSKAVDNCLKRSGRVDLCLNSPETEVLQSLTAFPKDSETLTEVVSSSFPIDSPVNEVAH